MKNCDASELFMILLSDYTKANISNAYLSLSDIAFILLDLFQLKIVFLEDDKIFIDLVPFLFLGGVETWTGRLISGSSLGETEMDQEEEKLLCPNRKKMSF